MRRRALSVMFNAMCYARVHGRNLVGDTGDVSPPLFQVGGYYMPCRPHFFSSGFIFGEVPKISDVCHILCEVLFILDVTDSQVDVVTEFAVVSLDSVSL